MKPLAILLLFLSLLLLLAAGILTADQIGRYNAVLAVYPAGTVIAGLPAGGLDRDTAGIRIAQVYSLTPVELRYNGMAIHLDPAAAGQQLDLQGMLERADSAQAGFTYWNGFWDFLWGRLPAGFEVPLSCSVDGQRLREYLPDLLDGRYNQNPTAARPIPGEASFLPGQPGETVNLDQAWTSIASALCSASDRSVEIAASASNPLPPDPAQLPLVLQALVQAHGFDGTLELYYQDLRSGEDIRLALQRGTLVEPDIAFTAASTIKIPVMISAYKRIDGELPAELARQMALMIDLSENTSTDEVMKRALDPNIAPVQVTQDMRALELENTFLAGFFYLGAPLLDRYLTPANQRADVSTDPDIYNQTTAADMGRLLAGIVHCAESGSGPLIKVFDGQVTQDECQAMLDLLASNRKGVLIEVGVPEGTRVAHKYGWVIDPRDGLMHAASDAAVVYTPGGNFILTAYLYHPEQLHWETAQRLVAHLTTAIYNYYNQWRE
jgi:beta-lactamase class A